MSARTSTSKITSITEIRAAARKRSATRGANDRLATAILLTVAVLLVIGLTATLSASSTMAASGGVSRWSFLNSHFIGIGIGIVAMVVASRVPYRIYERSWVLVFGTSIALLIAVLVIGTRVDGARRWIDLGPFNMQPSEVAKFATIVSLAAVLDKKRRLLDDLGHFFAPVFFIVGVTGALVMLQPDLGTTIVIGACALAVMVTSTAPLRYIFGTGVLGSLGAVILAFSADYRRERITGFLDPWSDAGDTGYQLIQSWYALGTGGLFGVGLGASRARWFYLPNGHTDFIFAIIGEEAGFVGASFVMLLFVLLGVAGWSVARRAPDGFGRMLAVGITMWISVQAIINIGGVIGVMPITGITLPFVSFGGSAVAVTLGAVGVLVNIASHGVSRSRTR